ncbi:TolC family protein [Aquirufa lenticrescens]|uniref:TolC family protein n=1 Tax=Aquirufa lenticrescens TaxID=2696560 RepID=UPI001CAA62C1|nr:TolC family protein [Aquirufa lenticrescens]UAJ14164.1 TolC family protein [Aquirufa lenticrescens]
MIRLRKIYVGLFLLTSWAVQAQSYSLKQAVDYAITHQVQVKNSQIDLQNAGAKINEIKAMGLPQVNGSVALTNNIVLQRAFIPAKLFNPAAADGELIAAKFGVDNSGFASVGLSQLVFDGSYLLGLKASTVYKDLAVKSVTQSKQQVAENVTKAYYGILVNEKRQSLLALNVARLDTLLKETRELNKQGFVEKIDVQRLDVQANNLRTELENVNRLQELSYALLKFQMGFPMEEPIRLSESLEKVELATFNTNAAGDFNYANRIEYSILQTQENLAELDLKSIKAGYLPRLVLNANYGYNAGANAFSDLVTKQWFDNAAITVALQIPIFDGFSKKYKAVQSANNLQKVRQSYSLLKSSIDLQRSQASITMKNALESMKEQKANLDLANEISRVTRVKYQQGVGSNLEVLNAESSIKESQANYFTALYNALVAKVELEKANGTLYID